MFSVRIVNVDYYLSTPLQGLDITYSQFRGCQVKQVPIIRIFGSTPAGKKTCLHIHGVFPYLLVPYDGSEDVQKLMYVIATSLDKAINISLGISNSTKQHVFKIVQVSGSPFYGYHEVEHQFFKIFFYNPNMVKRATDLLQNGAICNKVLQPHEAHVPFILQFFIDYNLHGMSFINLKHVLFRRSENEQPEFCETTIEIPLRISRCELEVDAIATDIHNKLDVTDKMAVNPGLTAIWEEEKQRREGNDTFFELVESQPRLNVESTLSEVLLRNKLRNTLSQQNKLLSMKLSTESVIPYPAETQEGSDIMNASALNTHCMVSLYSPKPDILDESVINEDVIYSLTSQSDEADLLNTQDQSLLNILQNLEDEGDTEVDKPASGNLQYIVEDDSILGSQLFTNAEDEEDLLEACEQIDDTVFQCENQHDSEEMENLIKNVESCNDNYWGLTNSEDIPQVDGTDDSDKTDKQLSCVENFSEECEMKIIDDIDCSSLIEVNEDMQSPSMWPVIGIGKEVDCCDEVFSNTNESINFVESSGIDGYENVDVVKIDMENNFNHVLRGDPSFMSQSVTSSFDETSLYTSKDSFTCSWNNAMASQQIDNSESIDLLLSRLSENNKLEDSRKGEFLVGIESDLTDFTEKSLQFTENLVPLLSLPECEESVYVKCTEGAQSLHSDEEVGKTPLPDILEENIPTKQDSPAKDIAVLQSNVNGTNEDNRCRRSLLKKVKKGNASIRKKSSKTIKKYGPLKLKFKFPVKGETVKLIKKQSFVKTQVAFDVTRENVEAYLKKLKNLETFCESNRVGLSSEKIKKVSKLPKNNISLTKDTEFQETKKENRLPTCFDEYKLKKCFVSLQRLQLKNNTSTVPSNIENKRALKQKKMKTKVENLNSRPFSTEIFKPNILINSSPDINKNIEKEMSIRECVKVNRQDKPSDTTKEIRSTKKPKKQFEPTLNDIKCSKILVSKNKKSSVLIDKNILECEEEKQPNILAISSSKINTNIVEEISIRELVKENMANELGNTKKEILPNKKVKRQHKSDSKDNKCLRSSVSKCEHTKFDFDKDKIQNEKDKHSNNKIKDILGRINIVENNYINNTQEQDFKNDCQQNINKSKMILKKIVKQSEDFCKKEYKHCENDVGLFDVKNKNLLKNNKKRRNPFIESKTELSSEINPCTKKKKRLEHDKHSHGNMNIVTNNNSYSQMIPSFFEEMKNLETNLDTLNNNSKNVNVKTEVLPNLQSDSDPIQEDNGKNSNQTKLIKKKRKMMNNYYNKGIKRKIRIHTNSGSGDKINSDDKGKKSNKVQHKPKNLNTKHIKVSSKRNHIVYKIRKYETRSSKQKYLKYRKAIKKVKVNKSNNYNAKTEKNAQGNDVKDIQVKEVIQKRKLRKNQHQNIKKKLQQNNEIVLQYNEEDNIRSSRNKKIKDSEQDEKSIDLKNFKSENTNQNYVEKNYECMKIDPIKHVTKPKQLDNTKIHKKFKVCKDKMSQNKATQNRTQLALNKSLKCMTEKPKLEGNTKSRVHKSDKQIKALEKQSIDHTKIIPFSAIHNTVKSEDPEIGSSNRPTIICSISKSKIRFKCKQTSKPSHIQFLDGTVDSMSSSSDESVNSEENNTTRTRLKKQLLSSKAETPTKRYKKLDIQIKKSPKAEKSAETTSTDWKLNTAVVKLVRNSVAEQMASRSRKGKKMQLSSEDGNSEFKITHSIEKYNSGSSDISRRNETSCNLKSELEPTKPLSDESKSVQPSTSATITNLNEQISYNAKSKNVIPPILFSKDSEPNLVLESERVKEIKVCSTVQVKSVEDKDYITCDNSFVSLPRCEKTLNKSFISKNNNILLQTSEESEPSTSFKNCDKRLLKQKYSLPELKVHLTRLSSHFTDVRKETVSNEKKLKETDIVDQIQVSDELSLTSGIKSRLVVNQSEVREKTKITSGCKSKAKKMLNFQLEETDIESGKNKPEDSFQPHSSSVKDGNKERSISGNIFPRKLSVMRRKPSIDLFASNSSDTQDSSPRTLSGNSENEKTIPTDILPENSSNDICNSNSSTNDFVRLSQSIKSDKGISESDDLNVTIQNVDDDEGILSFYGRTFSEDFVLPNSSILNESLFLIDQSKTSSLKNKIKTYQPMMNPPSSRNVKENMLQLGFAEVLNEEPFYSDPNHVCAASEVGGKTLKVISKSSVDLEEYQGTFNFMSKWLKVKFQEVCGTSQVLKEPVIITSVFASDRKVILAPLKPAPTTAAAKFWVKTKSVITDLKTPKEKLDFKIKKVFIPSSPGENSQASDEEIISSTPCTPLTGLSLDSVQSTPQELDIHLPSDVRTSTPLNIPSRKRPDLTKSSLIGRSNIPSLQPVPEENVETSCDENSKLNYSDNSVEQKYNKQASDVGNSLVSSQLQKQFNEKSSLGSNSYQIDAVTPDNTGGYKMALENLQDVHVVSQHQYLTILTMELHVQTRGDLKPDPQYDAITALFYNITNDSVEPELSIHITGAVIIGSEKDNKRSLSSLKCEFSYVEDEKILLQTFVNLVHKWDPDILAGYEIEMFSWGYLLQRGYVLATNLKTQLSRIIKNKTNNSNEDKENELKTSDDNEEELKLTGRIVLNVWRFLRHEVALMSYTFENVMYHILHQRVPNFSFKTLSNWWSHRTLLYRWKTAEHYIVRVEGVVKLLDQLDLVGRTSELARLFGIQFYEVLSRGSQYRVESMMLRLAKPLNYVAVTPSIKQRAKMRAPETLPLIMEPQSRFYCDPVIVLDFQSLYPSIIIAYKYCFSTCLGRVEHLGESEIFEFGCTQLKVPLKTIRKLENDLNFSPCGVAFVKDSVKKGVLPQMLEEILNTRLMVKKSMKDNKNNKTLQRVLHARQLGLKLIANVTYGYTAANFSGRMPCIEVGDSVVSKGRETLERAINLVGETSKWGAQVVYGDTDSLFVLVPGRSRKEAFRIGAEIAEAVTNSNPKPVKLKLEKVYQPCILQTKKRYVGYMYESPEQEKPVYDAKGIETVRRDGCPAVAKVLEKSLRLLFETKDLSLVKKYVTRQFSKIVLGRISIQELTFAKEYRGAGGYRPGACVPALELAKQWRATDPRAEPRVGERVPYVVVAGPPGLPLIRLVRSPSTLLLDPSLKINSEYYVTRVIIPPLDRCFSLLGTPIMSWYSELPRKHFMGLPTTMPLGSKKSTISQYFATMNCVVCQKLTSVGICSECQEHPQKLAVALSTKLSSWERRLRQVTKLCQSCCGRSEGIECISLDCPVLYSRNQAQKDMNQADFVRQLQCEFLIF